MKLEAFFIIALFAAGSAMAQNMEAAEKNNRVPGDKAIASRPQQADQYMQIAYVTPEERSIVELNAHAAGMKFTNDPNLYSEMKNPDHADAGVLAGWCDRVFKRLETNAQPRRFDPSCDSRMQSNTELDEQAHEGRRVTRIILRETLRYTQERMPETEALIKAMKFELSTDSIPRQGGASAGDPKTGVVRTVRHDPVEDRLSVKTGIRIPMDGGRLGVVSETEATYGNLSSFLKVRLDGQYDSTAGLIYVLGRDLRVQVEQQFTHETVLASGDTTNTRSSLGLAQLVCTF